MRFLVSAAILLLLVLPTSVAYATTLTLMPDGFAITGNPQDFSVFSSPISIDNVTGAIDITLNFNYPFSQLIEGEFPNHQGLEIKPADLLFVTGSHMWGIPIAPTVAPRDPTLVPGGFYLGTSFIDADTALGVANVDLNRHTYPVWIGGTLTLKSTLTEIPANGGTAGTSPRYSIHLTGFVPTLFLTDLNSFGVEALFASADCANGYATAFADPPPPGVPEPASLVLLATGLLGMGGLMRHRISRK